MPQMPAIQPVVPQSSPQAPPSSTPGNKERGSFSPHLDKALSGRKAEQQKPQDKTGRNKPDAAGKKTLVGDKNLSIDPHTAKDHDTLDSKKLPETDGGQILADNLEQDSEPTALPVDSQENIQPNTPSYAALQQDMKLSACLQDNGSGATTIATDGSEQVAVLGDTKAELPLKANQPADITAVVLEQTNPVVAGRQDSLLNQLQNIIAGDDGPIAASSGKDATPAIPVAVERDFYKTLTASLAGKLEAVPVAAEASGQNQTGLLLAEGDSITISTGKPLQHLTGIRQESQQQFFSIKIDPQNPVDDKQNFQDSQQGDDLARPGANTPMTTSTFGATEQTGTFSAMSALVQDTASQPAAETAKAIILPSGTIVHDQEVIHQLAERLQLSSKHMDSKINLKLHPAELGELKIDLTLKEGAIRANIVAQSQHTLEILEKNLPKLKNILENQGLDIEQLSLTAESGSVGAFDLFDRQLFNSNDHAPATAKGRRNAETAFTLEDIVFTAPEANTGVNVKI